MKDLMNAIIKTVFMDAMVFRNFYNLKKVHGVYTLKKLMKSLKGVLIVAMWLPIKE